MNYLFLLLFPLLLSAQTLHVNNKIPPISIEDQFEKSYVLGDEALWIIAWDKETTALANSYASKHAIFMNPKKAIVLVDTSQIPSGIYALFVRSKMQSYSHPIMQSFDEAYNKQLPYKALHVTILHLKDSVITSIEFADTLKSLEHLLKQSI